MAEKEKLGSLKDMNLLTSKAYNFKLSLKDFWTFNDKLLAEDFLKKWYYWATHSQIEPIINVAKTIENSDKLEVDGPHNEFRQYFMLSF